MKKVLLVMVIAGMVQTMHGQMQEAVEKIRSDYNLMGLSVATVCDGKVTGTYQAGLRDYDRNLPVDDKHQIPDRVHLQVRHDHSHDDSFATGSSSTLMRMSALTLVSN